MFKKFKLILITVFALMICFAGAPIAFAANPNINDKGALMAEDEDNPVKVAITQIIKMPVGTDIPGATFEFDVAPISVDDVAYDDTITPNMPDIGPISIMFDSIKAKPIAPADGVESYYVESFDIFQNVTFKHAGVYVYEITKIKDTNPAIDDNTDYETLTYSDAKYTINVYVENYKEKAGTYVYAVGTHYNLKDDSSAASGGKVDPTPGGYDEEYKYSQMIFNDIYIKTIGPDDPKNPDPTTESTLFISKTVAGELASHELYFNFSISITPPSLILSDPGYYRAYIVKLGTPDDEVIDPVNNAAGGLIGTDIVSTANYKYIKVSTSVPTSFSLKDGQRLVFVDTPIGTSYDISEIEPTGYIPSHIITTNNEAAEKVTGTVGQTLKASDQLVGKLTNTAAFTNTRDAMAPTGLSMDALPFIVMIALAVGALAIFIVVKSRKRKNYNF